MTWTDETQNAFPAGISYIITGLEEDAEYKVSMRPRYDDGFPGPWTSDIIVSTELQSNSDGMSDSEPMSEDPMIEVDTEPPVITVLGDNPITITVGDSYVDAGATCIDAIDGDITPILIDGFGGVVTPTTIENMVNVTQADNYEVIYY